MRILLIDGGARSKEAGPGEDSKSKLIMQELKKIQRKDLTVETVHLTVKGDGMVVQPCIGCIGTAGGYHCHWTCTCYGPGSGGEKLPDIMYDQNVYKKLERCDGFMVISPIHWYNVTTSVKAMFDRLVCANGTLTKQQAEDMFGKGNIKNPDFTQPESKSGKHDSMLKNHLEGKVASFFIWGDNGANDYDNKKLPDSMEGKQNEGYINKPEEAVMPYVWQCRYSGIHAPNELIQARHYGVDMDYATGDNKTRNNIRYLNSSKLLMLKLIDEIERQKR